jgi:hypothetical protein
MPDCNGPDRRQRALPERGADFRAVWKGENVCRIPSIGGKQVCDLRKQVLRPPVA